MVAVSDVMVAVTAVYQTMPPAAVPAKKANSGVAEQAFETNCRSAPFLLFGESAPVLFLKRLTNTVALGSTRNSGLDQRLEPRPGGRSAEVIGAPRSRVRATDCE